MATHNDNDLITLLRQDTEQGFRLLMARYKEAVYWHIRRLVVSHSDAQDACQEAFVRIFRSFNAFKGDNTFSVWIYRIATNEALRILNHKRDGQVSLDDKEAKTGNMAVDEYTDYSDLEAVRLQRAILSLPTKQQVAFNLRYYDDLGYNEIAQITASTAANVKANYHLAKEKIIKFMNSND